MSDYIPPEGSAISVSETNLSGAYTPPPGYAISFDDNDLDDCVVISPGASDITIPDTITFDGVTPSDGIVIGEPGVKYKMAVTEIKGILTPLRLHDAGKGFRCVVYDSGTLKKRISSEGKPIVLNDTHDGYKIIAFDEELVI